MATHRHNLWFLRAGSDFNTCGSTCCEPPDTCLGLVYNPVCCALNKALVVL